MQPLAIYAIAIGAVMIVGAPVTIFTQRDAMSRRAGINRWQLHGSIPLAVAGLLLGVVSRGSGQSAATHDVIYAVVSTMLLGALLCALVGAASVTRKRAL
jgi:ABC-type proline/glycine betaine transport system permease subunit